MALPQKEIVATMGGLLAVAGEGLQTSMMDCSFDLVVQGAAFGQDYNEASVTAYDPGQHSATAAIRVQNKGKDTQAELLRHYENPQLGETWFQRGPRGDVEYIACMHDVLGESVSDLPVVATLPHLGVLAGREIAVAQQLAGAPEAWQLMPYGSYDKGLVVRARHLLPIIGTILRSTGAALANPTADRMLDVTAHLDVGTPDHLHRMGDRLQRLVISTRHTKSGAAAIFELSFYGQSPQIDYTAIGVELTTEKRDQRDASEPTGHLVRRTQRLTQVQDRVWEDVVQSIDDGPGQRVRYGPATENAIVDMARRALSGTVIPEDHVQIASYA